MCVVTDLDNEEIAAYLRTVRSEYPDWKIECVRTNSAEGLLLQGGPIDDDGEGEWKMVDGRWFVRRMQWTHTRPLICAVHMESRGEIVILNLSRLNALA